MSTTGGVEPAGRPAGRRVVLHDVWGRAAAVDAESKMSEQGPAAAQVAGYHNFAHEGTTTDSWQGRRRRALSR